MESRLVVVRGWEEGIGSSWFMDIGFSFRVMKTFWNSTEVVVVQLCECTRLFTLKWFVLFCELHFSEKLYQEGLMFLYWFP